MVDTQLVRTSDASWLDGLAKQGVAVSAVAMCILHKQQGYKKLGYETFDNYAEDGLNVTTRTAYHWIDRVNAKCVIDNVEPEQLLEKVLESDGKVKLLPHVVAQELKRLDKPELMRRAYTEFIELEKVNGKSEEEARPKFIAAIVSRLAGKLDDKPTVSVSVVSSPIPVDKPRVVTESDPVYEYVPQEDETEPEIEVTEEEHSEPVTHVDTAEVTDQEPEVVITPIPVIYLQNEDETTFAKFSKERQKWLVALGGCCTFMDLEVIYNAIGTCGNDTVIDALKELMENPF